MHATHTPSSSTGGSIHTRRTSILWKQHIPVPGKLGVHCLPPLSEAAPCFLSLDVPPPSSRRGEGGHALPSAMGPSSATLLMWGSPPALSCHSWGVPPTSSCLEKQLHDPPTPSCPMSVGQQEPTPSLEAPSTHFGRTSLPLGPPLSLRGALPPLPLIRALTHGHLGPWGDNNPMSPTSAPQALFEESLLCLGLSSLQVRVTPESPRLLHMGDTALTMTTSDHKVTMTHVHLRPGIDSDPHPPHLSQGTVTQLHLKPQDDTDPCSLQTTR